jgi:hypothetical protein
MPKAKYMPPPPKSPTRLSGTTGGPSAGPIASILRRDFAQALCHRVDARVVELEAVEHRIAEPVRAPAFHVFGIRGHHLGTSLRKRIGHAFDQTAARIAIQPRDDRRGFARAFGKMADVSTHGLVSLCDVASISTRSSRCTTDSP